MKTDPTSLQRVLIHAVCLVRRPRHARFYLAGILREIPGRALSLPRALVGCFLIAILHSLCGCEQQSASAFSDDAAPMTEHRPSEANSESREMTYFTAKEAFGRLLLDLRARNQSIPRHIWYAVPERTAIYSYGSGRGLGGTVGGWVVGYEDAAGARHEARINCWGGLAIAPVKADWRKSYAGSVDPADWMVDNTDAHVIALRHGAIASSSTFGGWLMSVDVKGRGMRPVWAGGAWRLTASGDVVLVDANTGELYRSTAGRQLVPVDTGMVAIGKAWDGGFAPESIEAMLSRSEHPYWWPSCYQTSDRRYIYNRRLLLESIDAERCASPRRASSWFTTGVANAALGNWDVAVEDLNRAIAAEPENNQYRFYRGLFLLAVRALDAAGTDFMTAGNSKQVSDALNYLDILRGRKKAAGLSSFMYNIPTGTGYLPIAFCIGSEPLSRQ